MRTTPTILTLAALLAMSANAESVLTVRVYDYTGLSDNTILKAEALAQKIFHKAGVETEFVHCPTERGEEDLFPGCRKPRTAEDLILHICPRSMENPAFGPNAFGFALPAPGGRLSTSSYVFLRRVTEASAESRRRSQQISAHTLLGYVIAHELGHLLLGPGKHSRSGVMKARWEVSDFPEMERGAVSFDSRQVGQFRNRLQAEAGLR
jgi:hypothetical protein